MNYAKCVFVAGFLLAVLAGCFNPITPTDPNPPQQQEEDAGPASFTVDILIGDDAAEARFLAGPSTDQLTAAGDTPTLLAAGLQSKTIDKTTGGKNGNGAVSFTVVKAAGGGGEEGTRQTVSKLRKSR
jgi:hypothetical protein